MKKQRKTKKIPRRIKASGPSCAYPFVELADAVMKDILGISGRAVVAEKQKENPDIEKLNYPKEERRQLKAEQKQISLINTPL